MHIMLGSWYLVSSGSQKFTGGTMMVGMGRTGLVCLLSGNHESMGDGMLPGGCALCNPGAAWELHGLAPQHSHAQKLTGTSFECPSVSQEGRKQGNPTIGRYLAETLAVVPHFSKLDFERLFNDSVQDNMIVSYLSNLLRAQIVLAEKLGTAVLPLM